MWEVSQSCRRTHTHTKALCDIFSMTCHDRRTQFQSPMAEELAGWWYPIVRMDHYQHNLVDFHCCPVLLWSPCFLAKGLRLMFLMGSPPSNTAAINAPNWWCLFACFVKFWANRIFHCVNMCQLLFIHFFSLELGCSQQEKANRDFLDSEPPLHLVFTFLFTVSNCSPTQRLCRGSMWYMDARGAWLIFAGWSPPVPAMGIARKSQLTLSAPVATRSSSFALPYCNWHRARGCSCIASTKFFLRRWTHCMNQCMTFLHLLTNYGRCLLVACRLAASQQYPYISVYFPDAT